MGLSKNFWKTPIDRLKSLPKYHSRHFGRDPLVARDELAEDYDLLDVTGVLQHHAVLRALAV